MSQDEQISTINSPSEMTMQLIAAVQSGRLEQVAHLLRAGADLNARDADGRTAMDYARTDIMTDFLRSGGAYHSLDAHLIAAIKRGDMAVAEQLYNLGASIHAKDADGKSALRLAAEQGNSAAISAIIARVAPYTNIPPRVYGGTPLMSAASSGMLDAVQTLIKKGENLDVQNESGETAAMLAAKNGKTDVVCTLVDNNADMTIQDDNGQTVMHHMAAGTNETAAVEQIFTTIANKDISVEGLVETTDDNGNNVIHTAAQYGNDAVIIAAAQRMPQAERDRILSTANKEGRSPFLVALENGHAESARQVFENVSPETRALLVRNYLEHRDKLSEKDQKLAADFIASVPAFAEELERQTAARGDIKGLETLRNSGVCITDASVNGNVGQTTTLSNVGASL